MGGCGVPGPGRQATGVPPAPLFLSGRLRSLCAPRGTSRQARVAAAMVACERRAARDTGPRRPPALAARLSPGRGGGPPALPGDPATPDVRSQGRLAGQPGPPPPPRAPRPGTPRPSPTSLHSPEPDAPRTRLPRGCSTVSAGGQRRDARAGPHRAPPRGAMSRPRPGGLLRWASPRRCGNSPPSRGWGRPGAEPGPRSPHTRRLGPVSKTCKTKTLQTTTAPSAARSPQAWSPVGGAARGPGPGRGSRLSAGRGGGRRSHPREPGRPAWRGAGGGGGWRRGSHRSPLSDAGTADTGVRRPAEGSRGGQGSRRPSPRRATAIHSFRSPPPAPAGQCGQGPPQGRRGPGGREDPRGPGSSVSCSGSLGSPRTPSCHSRAPRGSCPARGCPAGRAVPA